MALALMLLILFAVLVILVVAILLIPVDISIRLVKEGPVAEVGIAFRLLLGALTGRIEYSAERNEFQARILGLTIFRRPLERAKEKGAAKKPAKKEKEKEGPEWTAMVANAGDLYGAGKELVRALTRHLSLKRVRGSLAVGLPDAAETGMLTGALYAGRGIVNAAFPQAYIELEPSFGAEKMNTDVVVEFSLPLITIIAPVSRFLWKMRKIFRAAG